MTRSAAYRVPSSLIASQGIKIATLFKADTAENQAKLGTVGLGADKFEAIETRAQQLGDLEQAQEEQKSEAGG